jgi:hypothetical protein
MDLWQTPTNITHLCLMDHDGIHWVVKGKAAARALRCYLEWVKSLYPYSVMNTKEEEEANADHRELCDGLEKEILTLIKNPRGLEVFAI